MLPQTFAARVAACPEESAVAVEIVMPRLSDSMEEGVILQWFVDEGDQVSEGAPLVEVETDKASVTYESEHDGVLLRIATQTGESAAVGAVIAVVGETGETAKGADRAGRVKASPLARRIAAELGVDLATLAGSGPQGRVIRADVERSAPPTPPTPPAPPTRTAEPRTAEPAQATTTAKGETTRRPLTRLQQTVARRMAESRATVPDFELRAEVDMQRLVELRSQLSEVTDRAPSVNDFIVKAAALALREFPRVNGAYRDAEFEGYARVNVGIAVAAEEALLVPTIFDADAKSLGVIATEARELAARVRDGSISPAELAGGTFSVSNLGMFGVDSFSAVVNPPQAAILAVGSLRRRPVVDESDPSHPVIVPRPTVNLTLACDHRILYGADGARFLTRVRELLERPVALLVG
jgi:pyruvate dehydrogenase E2 component (dihydrolipoamide acetyltransferase)